MNERIRDLFEDAGGYYADFEDDGNFQFVLPDLEKFAELIVKDTINIMKQEWYDRNNAPEVEGETPRDIGLRVGAKSQTIRLMHMVQKHFGIEK